jgi:hypothetical protein
MPKQSKHYKFQRLEFWAENGLITMIDEDKAGNSGVPASEAIRRISPVEFLERVVAVRMGTPDYSDELFLVRQFLDRAVEVIKIARAQGDPTDPTVLAHMGKHARRSQILMPGDFNSGNLAPLRNRYDEKALSSSSSRQKVLDGKGVTVKPDLSIGPGSYLTPERANKLRKQRSKRR